MIITGATASLRGSAKYGDFAAGKFAVRALGQSLAREFGPKGVHVAHSIIDGAIDTPRIKHIAINGGGPDTKIDPDAVRRIIYPDHLIVAADRMAFRLLRATGICIRNPDPTSLRNWIPAPS